MENKTVSDELFTDGGGDLIAEGEALEESAKRADAEEGTKRRRRGDKLKKRSFRADIPFYLLLLPALVIVILFKYLPMTGLLLAFKDWDAKLGMFGSPWTDYYGFGNFVRLFKTPELVQSIVNTLYFNVVNIIIEFPAPIILALLITEIGNKAFKRVTQTISYLPHFLSMAAVTGIVNSLLSQYGLVNSVLGAIFGDSDGQHIMSNSAAFLPVYVITNVWKNVGWGTIVYLAAICGLSEDLYEAAEIDGAGRFKQVMYITIPGIAPTIGILLILKMGSLFASSFELVYGLQNPVAWTQEVISTAVYKNGIGQGEYSISTALGLMQGIVALILTFGTNWISKKVSSVSMW